MKREKGKVTLFQPPGTTFWWVRYTVNGKRIRRTTGHKDEHDAGKFALDIERALGRATSPDAEQKALLLDTIREIAFETRLIDSKRPTLDPTMTAGKWFTNDFRRMQKPRGDDAEIKDTSLQRIDAAFADFTKYLESRNLLNVPLGRITPDDIIGFMNRLKKQGLYGTTRLWTLTRIKASFSRAVQQGIIATNPASRQNTGKMKFHTRSIRQPFNTAQIELILTRIEDPKYKNYFPWMRRSALLGLFTLQREGDICAMRWEYVRDLECDLPIIDLTDQIKTKDKENPLFLEIPIAEPLREELLKTPKAARKGFLLPTEVCEAFHAGRKRRFQRPWLRLFSELDLAALWGRRVVAKVEPTGERGRTRNAWSFHSFRHTGDKYLSGADLHYLTGHRSAEEREQLGTTIVYQHEDLERIKKALDAIPLATAKNVVPFQRVRRTAKA